MYTLEEITNALKVIQDVCKNNYHCADCPLRKNEDKCAIVDNEDVPKNWNLYDPQNIRLVL